MQSQAGSTPRPTSPFAPFRHAEFRLLWSVTLISNFGGMVQAIGAAWLMTQLTSSATLIALVQASSTLPIMMFALVSGALADIFDQRRLMLIAQGGMALTSVALAVTAYFGVLTPWALLGLTFVIGLGRALYNPPWQTSICDIVPRKDLPAAVTLNSVGVNMMRSVGPAAGGIITAVFGAAATFAVNAVCYIPLLTVLTFWRPRTDPALISREPFIPAIGAGLRYVALSPDLLRVMARGTLFGFASIVLLALLPLVAKSHPEGGSLLFGILMGCYGLGAIIGAVLNPVLRDRFNNETVVQLAFVGFAMSALIVVLSDTMWLHALAILPAGACWVLALSLFNVTVQLSTPRWVMARTLALYQTTVFGGMAAGSWAWGSLANAQGWQVALATAAGLLLAGAFIGIRFLRVPEFVTRDLDPANSFREPPLQLDLRGRSGPIFVMVDYRIDAKDVPEFLCLMRQRRQIRRRDGARNWALLRDLEQPEIWSESYHIATWDAYIRHNLRRTKADAEIALSLSALHQGTAKPRVHRMIERHNVTLPDDVPLIGRLQF